MARFYPLYVRRSDGKLEITGKGRLKEGNRPTDVQLDQRPNKDGVSDYYREVAPEEMKHLDWRRKLGGMLARELQWKDKTGGGAHTFSCLGREHSLIILTDNGCILVTFPEHYRLYEHVKKTEKDGTTEVKTKTHAGGGNDRQDAYLYGHPAGRRKRFRSPNDFFPHLLWLATDESGDPDNCGCKICSPDDIETVFPHMKAVKPEKPTKQEIETKPLVNQASVPLARQGSNAGQQRLNTPVNTPRQLVPTPLPTARSHDQAEDRRYRTFMYRPGEVVWFKRQQAWGLGAVLRRWRSSSNQVSYTVQPLTYPGGNSTSVTKTSDVEMRPWLAWSVPQFTHPALNNMPQPPRYDNADWEGMRQKRYGNGGDLEVDGSILAAKSVDSTYTPFGQQETRAVDGGTTETHYNGVFLGAEKIWVGEPIRLAVGQGTDIMVLHSIIERRRTSPMAGQAQQQTLSFIGDVYSLSTVQHMNPNVPTPASPAMNPHLPLRLTEDLAFRNVYSIHTKREASYWKLMAVQSRIDLGSVKGRWYEASLLLPILQGEGPFQQMAAKGDIVEASLYMNARGDCQNANRAATLPVLPKPNIRVPDRRQALGRAVPQGVEIKYDGTEAPLPDNVDPALAGSSAGEPIEIDPRFDTAQDVGGVGPGVGAESGGLDDFMNLDDHTDLPGFGQEYGSQSQYF